MRPADKVAGVAARMPDKPFFKIGEVAQLVGVEPYVLRYWQTEFPSIRPQKSGAGHRVYRRADVERLVVIKRLLHQEGFTIAGARKRLRELAAATAVATVGAEPSAPAPEPALDSGRALTRLRRTVDRLRRELEELGRLAEADGSASEPSTLEG